MRSQIALVLPSPSSGQSLPPGRPSRERGNGCARRTNTASWLRSAWGTEVHCDSFTLCTASATAASDMRLLPGSWWSPFFLPLRKRNLRRKALLPLPPGDASLVLEPPPLPPMRNDQFLLKGSSLAVSVAHGYDSDPRRSLMRICGCSSPLVLLLDDGTPPKLPFHLRRIFFSHEDMVSWLLLMPGASGTAAHNVREGR
ncbi:hypothetical protein HPB50_012649 [Hyalomma asiaticum]|uniref:Uncharacterized protein n=1 Tax=Hyalomma asiaticum TaxID=266040 RepID=A0ACB7TFG9_HYAAI|nr:hypothetical protein HPB50_012649 [Hyalomma asiaticum]